jgi:cytidylate kinase
LIREESVAKNISIFSENSEVRDFVNAMLRSWASKESIIMDGRDIGTVVFPDADLKIYLDASVDVRTEEELKNIQIWEKMLTKIISEIRLFREMIRIRAGSLLLW